MSLDALYAKIAEWQQETFGDPDPRGAAHHLLDEAKEIVADIEGNKPVELIGEELADAFFMWIQTCRSKGIDPIPYIEAKYEKNTKREWNPPDEFGRILHKK